MGAVEYSLVQTPPEEDEPRDVLPSQAEFRARVMEGIIAELSAQSQAILHPG